MGLGPTQCWINLVAKVSYATGPALSRALCSLCLRGCFFSFVCCEDLFIYIFFPCRFPQGPAPSWKTSFFFFACQFFPQRTAPCMLVCYRHRTSLIRHWTHPRTSIREADRKSVCVWGGGGGGGWGWGRGESGLFEKWGVYGPGGPPGRCFA